MLRYLNNYYSILLTHLHMQQVFIKRMLFASRWLNDQHPVVLSAITVFDLKELLH